MSREAKDVSSSSGGVFSIPSLAAPLGLSGAFAPALPPGATVSRGIEATIAHLASTHNAMHGDDPAKKADVRALRTVYRRGARAYSPKNKNGRSRRQHALARVHAHLALLATGKRPSSKYTNDDDVLPAAHPLAPKESKRLAVLVAEGGRREPREHLAALAPESKAGGPRDAGGTVPPTDRKGNVVHVGAHVDAGRGKAARVVSMTPTGHAELVDGDQHRWTADPATLKVTMTRPGYSPSGMDDETLRHAHAIAHLELGDTTANESSRDASSAQARQLEAEREQRGHDDPAVPADGEPYCAGIQSMWDDPEVTTAIAAGEDARVDDLSSV
jgi:hypothetical protein